MVLESRAAKKYLVFFLRLTLLVSWLCLMLPAHSQSLSQCTSNSSVGISCYDLNLNGAGNISIDNAAISSNAVQSYFHTPVSLFNAGTTSSITNDGSGIIFGSGSEIGIGNIGTITALTNAGLVTGGYANIFNADNSTINAFNNYGVLANSRFGFYTRGLVDTFVNGVSGQITGQYSGVYNEIDATIGTFTNNGLIQATDSYNPEGVVNYHNIQTFINNGTISVGNAEASIAIHQHGTSSSIGVIVNNGTISAGIGYESLAIDNEGSIGLINNTSTLSTSIANISSGVLNSGNIEVINNSGNIISGPSLWGSGYGAGILNVGSIGTITNTGSISITTQYDSFYPNFGGFGIANFNLIGTLNNLQGAGSSTGPLSYYGNLPNNYNIIINDPTHYGQLIVTSPGSSQLTFGVYSGSTLVPGVYNAVLSGLTSSNISDYSAIYNVWNILGSYKWELTSGVNSSTFNLVVASNATNISSNSGNLLSNLGGTLNPVLDGGVLTVDTNHASVSDNLSITTAGGVINQGGNSATFSGVISDATSGGKLTIVNTGSGGLVTLSGNNTYSGGTEVDHGANLSISAANNIGTGPLSLVGSSQSPATLTTTASMTINNPVFVSGDPVFNIAPGTITTISSSISNGVSAGDVVVSGNGTLALTAANSYTGPTNVDAGSTLALVGAGSITPSSSLNNNGTVDVRSANGNVALGGNFIQTSTGNLLMNISPTNNQQINVTGATRLAGSLSLDATAGTYTAGKYTLLTANGVAGTFGTFTSNLSAYTRLGYALGYDAKDVYLYLTPNVADTQQSLVNTASALQNIYTLQNTVLANSFSYDCNLFGDNDVCISAGGRNTAVSASNGLNNTSSLLIAAYRPHPNYRIGAYADQNLSVNNAGSTVNLGNNTPLIGLFGAWNERLDGAGTEVKVSAAYGQKNATITRQVVGTSEPGTGSSTLKSDGAQLTAKYGFEVADNAIVTPYVGIRYTLNNMPGYTESTSSTVTAPLTYYALNTNATTALAGVGASYKVIPSVTTFASAGVESDTNTTNGTYTAFGVAGITPINFNPNPVKTRPTATLGAYYDIDKNQRLGITGIYRQEPFQAVQTTTVMATYMVGF